MTNPTLVEQLREIATGNYYEREINQATAEITRLTAENARLTAVATALVQAKDEVMRQIDNLTRKCPPDEVLYAIAEFWLRHNTVSSKEALEHSTMGLLYAYRAWKNSKAVPTWKPDTLQGLNWDIKTTPIDDDSPERRHTVPARVPQPWDTDFGIVGAAPVDKTKLPGYGQCSACGYEQGFSYREPCYGCFHNRVMKYRGDKDNWEPKSEVK